MKLASLTSSLSHSAASVEKAALEKRAHNCHFKLNVMASKNEVEELAAIAPTLLVDVTLSNSDCILKV